MLKINNKSSLKSPRKDFHHQHTSKRTPENKIKRDFWYALFQKGSRSLQQQGCQFWNHFVNNCCWRHEVFYLSNVSKVLNMKRWKNKKVVNPQHLQLRHPTPKLLSCITCHVKILLHSFSFMLTLKSRCTGSGRRWLICQGKLSF